MAIKLPAKAVSPVSLEEYLVFLDEQVDCTDPDSLVGSAPMLRRLAANRGFLGQWFAERFLRNGSAFQRGNDYNFQSIVLAVTDHYLLRANFWKPLSGIQDRSGLESDAFGYGVAHNHSFHLLTIGYVGSGYETDMYRLSDPEPIYDVGEKVELESRGTWHLGLGEMMFYEAYADVHSQIAPTDLSVSLNLMTHSRRDALPQYTFDVSTGQVLSLVGSPLDVRVQLLSLARLLIPDEADAELRAIRDRDPSSRLRMLARDALGEPQR